MLGYGAGTAFEFSLISDNLSSSFSLRLVAASGAHSHLKHLWLVNVRIMIAKLYLLTYPASSEKLYNDVSRNGGRRHDGAQYTCPVSLSVS